MDKKYAKPQKCQTLSVIFVKRNFIFATLLLS